jgi:hypothetical protein
MTNDLKNLKIMERETFSAVIRRIIDANAKYEYDEERRKIGERRKIEDSLDICKNSRIEYGIDPNFGSSCLNLACFPKCSAIKGFEVRDGKVCKKE